MKINVKNEDILAQRLTVKKARTVNVKVMLNEMGPVILFSYLDCFRNVQESDRSN
jgi:hypothetical protein